ncbi:MAG: LPS export ABC transporter periplasmic protein LptC [Alphaproteobacteria bacterium]|nr:LPS export ABC transporter periplasmic protein LptC [Alphaproteobacteria bacterium]
MFGKTLILFLIELGTKINNFKQKFVIQDPVFFFRTLKIVLPIFVLCAGGLLIWWSYFKAAEQRFSLNDSKLAPSEIDGLNMVNPKYSGVDSSGRVFTLTAQTAKQIDPETGIIHLEKPTGDVTLKDGKWFYLQAGSGNFSHKEKFLELNQEVQLHDNSGLEFHTKSAHIDLENGNARGTDSIIGTGSFGNLNGSGFEIQDNGKNIKLLGKSNLILNNRPQP